MIFDYNNESFGAAFKIDQEILNEGVYLVLSLVNPGKIRIMNL